MYDYLLKKFLCWEKRGVTSTQVVVILSNQHINYAYFSLIMNLFLELMEIGKMSSRFNYHKK